MSLSRRSLLKRLGVAGSAAIVPLHSADAPAATADAAQAPAASSQADAFQHLTPAEAAVLEAVTARIIPSDENGPGAKDARAARYIDRALGGALAGSRAAYSSGLAALEAYAQSSKGAPFTGLSPADQDAVLTEVQSNKATGFSPSGQSFFGMVRTHTIEGTFGDPYYGGNAGFVGWDLIGYPGVRLSVTPAEQQMGVKLAANHQSAYDFAMFAKDGRPDAH